VNWYGFLFLLSVFIVPVERETFSTSLSEMSVLESE
jgi:hypothetical protein